MKHGDSLDDLLVRSRREPLAGEEDRRLRETLAASEEMRLLYEAGRAFDREAPVEPGDDERVARLLEAFDRRPWGAVRKRPQRPLLGALAVGLLLGAVAGAAVGLRNPVLRAQAPAGSGESSSEAARPSELRRGRQEAKQPAAPEAAPVVADPTGSAKPVSTASDARAQAVQVQAKQLQAQVPESSLHSDSPGAPPPAAVPSAGPAEASFEMLPSDPNGSATAAALFAGANRARVAGDAERANSLYRRLLAEFPRSSEALTARLSLGLLLLQKGEARAALEHFRAYQLLGRGPTLVEAHWGEAQALRELALPREERAALQRVIERFSDSAYARASKNRMRELDSP